MDGQLHGAPACDTTDKNTSDNVCLEVSMLELEQNFHLTVLILGGAVLGSLKQRKFLASAHVCEIKKHHASGRKKREERKKVEPGFGDQS